MDLKPKGTKFTFETCKADGTYLVYEFMHKYTYSLVKTYDHFILQDRFTASISFSRDKE